MTTPDNDEDKLEEICADFIRSLIKNKFDDQRQYIELAKRISGLIDAEVRWQLSQEERRILMSAWGPMVN